MYKACSKDSVLTDVARENIHAWWGTPGEYALSHDRQGKGRRDEGDENGRNSGSYKTVVCHFLEMHSSTARLLRWQCGASALNTAMANPVRGDAELEDWEQC